MQLPTPPDKKNPLNKTMLGLDMEYLAPILKAERLISGLPLDEVSKDENGYRVATFTSDNETGVEVTFEDTRELIGLGDGDRDTPEGFEQSGFIMVQGFSFIESGELLEPITEFDWKEECRLAEAVEGKVCIEG